MIEDINRYLDRNEPKIWDSSPPLRVEDDREYKKRKFIEFMLRKGEKMDKKIKWIKADTLPEWGRNVLIAYTSKTTCGEIHYGVCVGERTEADQLFPHFHIPKDFKAMYWSYIPSPHTDWENNFFEDGNC